MWPGLHSQLGESFRPALDGGFIEAGQAGQVPVEADRALAESPGHVSLVGKGAIGVVGIAPGQGQVADAVQPCVPDPLPVGAKIIFPLAVQIHRLRHDMFDAVVVHGYVLFPAKGLEAVEAIAAQAEIVEIAIPEIVGELVVGREAAMGRLLAEPGLHAFRIVLGPDVTRKVCEQKAMRPGVDTANRAAYDEGLDQVQYVEEIRLGQCLLRIIMVEAQQERKSRGETEPAQVAEATVEMRIRLTARKSHADVMRGALKHVCKEGLDFGGPGIFREEGIQVGPGNRARVERQIMADEGLEVMIAAGLREAKLQGAPKAGVQHVLTVRRLSHQEQVADHVGCLECAASGIRPLEYLL